MNTDGTVWRLYKDGTIRVQYGSLETLFRFAVQSATGLDFSQKNEGPIREHRKRVCHCTSKTGGVIVFTGHYPQVVVEQLE